MARKPNKLNGPGTMLLREVPVEILRELDEWAKEVSATIYEQAGVRQHVSRSTVAIAALQRGIEAHKEDKAKQASKEVQTT